MANCGHFYFPVQSEGTGGAFKPVVGANVLLCEPNTCTISPAAPGTPIGQAIFSDPLGANQIANPLTADGDGVAECYALYAQSLDVFVNGGGAVAKVFRWQIEPYGSTP